MAFKPNYNQQRADRNRSKAQKKQDKLQKREEEAAKRKALRGDGDPETDGEKNPRRTASEFERVETDMARKKQQVANRLRAIRCRL